MSDPNPTQMDVSPAEKWRAEMLLKERELTLKERDQKNRDAELELKLKESGRSPWKNPVFVAVFAAIIAALGNAAIALLNGKLQRDLDLQRSEQARIQEMIKTGSTNTEKAAENLAFLVEAGLVSEPLKSKLSQYLAERRPGSGPSLPSTSEKDIPFGGIVGPDDAISVSTTPAGSTVRAVAQSVGQLSVEAGAQWRPIGSAFVIETNLILTALHNVDEARLMRLTLFDEAGTQEYETELTPLFQRQFGLSGYAVLKIRGTFKPTVPILPLSPDPPRTGSPISFVFFRDSTNQLAVSNVPDCRVSIVEEHIFYHVCDSGPGSSGGPLFARDGRTVLGLHTGRSPRSGGIAIRSDVILNDLQAIRKPERQ